MAIKKTTELTDAQRRALREMDDKKYQFPTSRLVRSCERLEHLGLAEGELHHAYIEFKPGYRSTTFKRAYRITKAGKKALK